LFAVIGGSIHFALQKHNLPEAELLRILFIIFHLLSPFSRNSAIDKGTIRPLSRATLMPLANWEPFGRF
jgi:hypothetical protein